VPNLGPGEETRGEGRVRVPATGDLVGRYAWTKAEGCEGYSYKFRYDNALAEEDFVLREENEKVLFAVGEEDFRLLRGATVDFATEMMRQTFYVKENPNAELSCSCKTSFSPKEHVV
jgi:iron-sulfur cluster assembly accessory protein